MRPAGAAAVAFLLCCPLADAGQAWLEAGNAQLRDDLMRLADGGVVTLPLTGWPIPVADVERALAGVDQDKVSTVALQAALDRVAHAIRADSYGGLHLTSARAAAGQPKLLREFDTRLREEGELGVGVAALGNRWAAELQLTGVSSPADRQICGSMDRISPHVSATGSSAPIPWIAGGDRVGKAVSCYRAMRDRCRRSRLSVPRRSLSMCPCCAGSVRGSWLPSWARWKIIASITTIRCCLGCGGH